MADYDLYSLESADGLIFYFPTAGEYFFQAIGNFGAPPIEYQTRRGYQQDGVTEVGFTLNARSIAVSLYAVGTEDREEYWARRAEFLDFLRPNRNGQMTLTVRQVGDVFRSIMVRPTPGLTFPPTDPSINTWNIDEDITFEAFNPLWFDPTATTIIATGAGAAQLVFPITFPIVFDPDGVSFSQNITYVGTWRSYPTITLTGPFTGAILEHVTIGAVIGLNTPVAAGDSRVITLTPGNISIVDSAGTDKFDELIPQSNLVDFALYPTPEVAGGINQISASLTGGIVGTSGIQFSYNNRYFGI